MIMVHRESGLAKEGILGWDVRMAFAQTHQLEYLLKIQAFFFFFEGTEREHDKVKNK